MGIGSFGGGFVQGLGAGADFARQYQDGEKRRAQEALARWSAEEMSRGQEPEAALAPAPVAVPAPAPAPAPMPEAAAPAPAPAQSYKDAFSEALEQDGPPNVQPMTDATRAQMPPQVDNPAPGRGIGAGMATLLHRPAAEAAPAMLKTSAPAQDRLDAAAPALDAKPAPAPVASPAVQAAPAPAPTPVVPASQAQVEQPVGEPAKRKFSIDDYYAKYAQKAASLGLSDEANKAMAEVVARKYSNAAMNAYMNGNYDDIYRVYNLLPDGHSVKRDVLPTNADGTGGGIQLTVVNDKTGQPVGKPRTFANEREAAGAMMAAADPKLLVGWMTAQGKEDNTLTKMMLMDRQAQARVEEIRRSNDMRDRAAAEARQNQLIGAIARMGGGGTGSGSGSKTGKGGEGGISQKDFFDNVVGKVDGAAPAWGTNAWAYYNQVIENNPTLAASQGGQARAAAMARNMARADAGEDVPVTGQANYRPLPILNANGTWDEGARDDRGNTYYTERGINPTSMIRKDKDGKTIGGIDDAWIKQQEVGFMQNYAKANPTKYSQLVAAAQDKSKLADLPALSPADTAVLRMADKYGPNPTAAAPAAGTTPAAPAAPRQIFTPAELQDAKSLGVEPTVPLATRLGNAWNGVKSAVSSATDFSPESFGRYVANARRTGRFDADAQLLMAAMQRNPELAKQLTPKELNAVKVAANKRL